MTELIKPNIQNETPKDDESRPVGQKEKIRSVMEAASALTSLGDEESGSRPTSPKPSEATLQENEEKAKKRFLPEHKKADAAPTFPEKLMNLMKYAEEQGKKDKDYCICWMPEGKSFVIKSPDDFSRNVVPKFFKPTKFSSFTRKLYRWGFRQINRGIGPDDPIIFGNEYFDRDNEELMSKMRSVTAASTRKAEQTRAMAFGKRPFEQSMYEQGYNPDQKRFLFDHLFHQKANLMHQNPSLYGGMSAGGAMMPLSNALRPGMEGHPSQMMSPGKQYDMPMQPMPMYHQQGHPQHQHNSMQGPPPPNMGYHHMAPPPNMGGMPNQGGTMAPPQQQQQQHHSQAMPQGGQQGPPGSYPNPQSTAEIVNAAIQALRQAN